VKVLLVEDNQADARLLQEKLNEGGLTDCQLSHVTRLADGLQLLDGQAFDVVFLDLSLPDAVGLEIVVSTQQRAPRVPIIVLTGTQDEQLGVAAIQAGAQDYLVKRTASGEVVCRALRYALERKQLGERLLSHERLETAGRIARQVADDFNNLLVSLMGYPDLIKIELPAEHRAVAYCQAMQEAAQQMAAINENLLALTHRGRVAATPIDVNRTVVRMLASLPTRRDVSVKTELADDVPPVLGMAKEISTIGLNLSRTAMDCLPHGGTVVVRTSAFDTAVPVGRDGHVPPGAYVRLDVSHSGSEIPEGFDTPMFEWSSSPTSVPKRRGASLDLNVVRALLADLRGYLDLSTEPGVGVTLSVVLPALVSTECAVPQECGMVV
jgi:DNA-binding response OmpR family regulator